MRQQRKKVQAQTLLQVFDADNERFRQRVGRDRSQHTYQIKTRARDYVADYLRACHHTEDVPLSDLTLDFIRDFSTYLSVRRRLRGGTVWLACVTLKGVVLRACQRGLLTVNPFSEFRIAKNIRERQYLTEEELHRLIAHPFPRPQQAYARDLFVFSALTGMSFVDITQLRLSDIQQLDGHSWIIASRQKTGIPFRVRLLPLALRIVHRHVAADGHPFRRYGYHAVSKHLRLVMAACGITKHVTLHGARHSFAVMALNHGMPMESVSRILGHSNIATTQIYARITMSKLNADFGRLEAGLAPFLMPRASRPLHKKIQNGLLSFLHLLTRRCSVCTE